MSRDEGAPCGGCGRLIPSFCAVCGRELLCGDIAEPCERVGCLEMVHPLLESDKRVPSRVVERAEHWWRLDPARRVEPLRVDGSAE